MVMHSWRWCVCMRIIRLRIWSIMRKSEEMLENQSNCLAVKVDTSSHTVLSFMLRRMITCLVDDLHVKWLGVVICRSMQRIIQLMFTVLLSFYFFPWIFVYFDCFEFSIGSTYNGLIKVVKDLVGRRYDLLSAWLSSADSSTETSTRYLSPYSDLRSPRIHSVLYWLINFNQLRCFF